MFSIIVSYRARFVIQHLVSIIVAISLLINSIGIRSARAATGIVPDSFSVEYSNIPSILQAETLSEEILSDRNGVRGVISITNPYKSFFLKINVAGGETYNIEPDDLKSDIWYHLKLIKPGDTLKFRIQFNDTSQMATVTSQVDFASIFVSVMVPLLGEIPGVAADSPDKIISAMGDIASIAQDLDDYGGGFTALKEVVHNPLSLQTPDRLVTAGKGIITAITSDVGKAFLLGFLDKINSQVTVEEAVTYLTNWTKVLTICKLLTDSLITIGAYFVRGGDLSSVITVKPTVFGPGIPPQPPILISPIGKDAPISPLFTWKASGRATSYKFQLDTDLDFSPTDYDRLYTTSYQFPVNLQPNTVYYWRITAQNSYGNESQASIGSFITGGIVYPPDPIPTINDQATFVTDVTIPDGLSVPSSQTFTKTWRLRNNGTTTWESNYKLVYVNGEQMGAPKETNIRPTAPDQTVDISVSLTSPTTSGNHIGYFQLRNPQGTYFGPKISVMINVRSTSSKITVLTADPVSPADTKTVRITAKADGVKNLRAMRLKVDGQLQGEYGGPEYTFTWNTNGFSSGAHVISVEAADQTDTSWSHPEVRTMAYTLTGVSASANLKPNLPNPTSPYDWYVYYSGSTARLCAQANGDPDGDSIASYEFEIHDSAQNWDSGFSNSDCVTTSSLGAYTYQWHVRVKDSRGAVSDWSKDFHFTIVNQNLSFSSFDLIPLDGNSEDVRLKACVTGQGGVGITIRFLVNSATDGTDSGYWTNVGELGVPCFTDKDAPVWHTLEDNDLSGDGRHLVRVEAHGASTSWSGAVSQDKVITLPHRRPSISRLQAPVPDSLDSREAIFFNTRSIPFHWYKSDRASSYRLSVSLNPSPQNDSNPVFRQTYSADTLKATVTFAQDYPVLYWQIEAINDAGINASVDQLIGIDQVAPACTVTPSGTDSYENNFQVNWSGSDSLAGIRSYDIQYLDSGRGDWSDWSLVVPASKTYDLFNGQPGHSYSFRCRATDNGGNTGEYPENGSSMIKIDPAGRPLEPWWNSEYAGKRNLTVLNNMPGVDLPVGYPVLLHFDSGTTPSAADLYDASQSDPKCDDLRIVASNTTDLNRVVTTCSATEINIWFRTTVLIPAGTSTTTTYQIYFGNSNPGTPSATYSQVFSPGGESDSAFLYYFQEGSGSTVYDSSGNGRNCTLNPTVQWSSAKFGSGLQFNRANNGQADGLSCPSLPLSSFTVDFWFKTQSNLGGVIAAQMKAGVGNSWMLSQEGDKIRMEIWHCSSCASHAVKANFSLNDSRYFNKWNHIAVVFGGSNEVKFYINGTYDSTQYMDQGGIYSLNIPLHIGSNGDSGQLIGNLGAFRLSTSAKTSFVDGPFSQIVNEPAVAAGGVINPPVNGSVDLSIQSLNSYPNPTGGLLIESVVTNQGSLSTTNGFYTDLYINHLPTGSGDYSGSLQFWVNDPIPAGGTATLTTILTDIDSGSSLTRAMSVLPAQETNGTLYAQVDSTGSLTETDKSNNITQTGLDVCFAAADAYETDDTFGDAYSIDIDEPQNHNFNLLTDKDWVKFTAQAGLTYQITTSDLGTSSDTYLYLYDQDGNTLLASNDDYADTLASQIEWTAASSGTYYILVQGWNPNVAGCGTSYTLDIHVKPDPSTSTPTVTDTPSATPTPVATRTKTRAPYKTPTKVYLPTRISQKTPTPYRTPTKYQYMSRTPTRRPQPTQNGPWFPNPTKYKAPTRYLTPTRIWTNTPVPTMTMTPSPLPTFTMTPSLTPSPTETETGTATDTAVPSVWDLAYSSPVTQIRSMAVYNDKLYASGFTGQSNGHLFVFDGSQWTDMGFSIGSEYSIDMIEALDVFDNALYIGTRVHTGSNYYARVYRYDGSSFTQELSTTGRSGFSAITDFEVHQGVLYTCVAAAGYGSVYRRNPDDSWTQIGNTFPNSTPVNALASYNGDLYAGVGTYIGNGAEVYRWEDPNWVLIENLTNTYTQVDGVSSFITFDGILFVGFTGPGIYPSIPIYDGTTWGSVSFENDSATPKFAVFGDTLWIANRSGKNFLYKDGNFVLDQIPNITEQIMCYAYYDNAVFIGSLAGKIYRKAYGFNVP